MASRAIRQESVSPKKAHHGTRLLRNPWSDSVTARGEILSARDFHPLDRALDEEACRESWVAEVPEEEIEERSKASGFSKVVAMIRISWFVPPPVSRSPHTAAPYCPNRDVCIGVLDVEHRAVHDVVVQTV